MSINFDAVNHFYTLTNNNYGKTSYKIEEKQNLIKEEIINIKRVVDELRNQEDPWVKNITHSWALFIEQAFNSLNQLLNMHNFTMEFDGLIFMVAGAVNSGKSSLGNFVAGHDFLNRKEVSYNNQCSKYSLFDSNSNKRIPINHFSEKATECTSSIQAFELNSAFTWVDTPGLASLTKANGELAKRYLEAADLVIFVISSDAPMTNEDIKTLKSLSIDQGKPFTILVTKFDEVMDWDDDLDVAITPKRVPKPERNRYEQEQYIIKSLQEHKLDNLASQLNPKTLIFFSKYCAAEALLNNDQALWVKSGANSLFNLFNQVLTNEASQIKRIAPIKKYNAMLRKIMDGEKSNADEPTTSLTSLIYLLESDIENIKKRSHSFKNDIQTHFDKITLDIINNTALYLRQFIDVKNNEELFQDLSNLIDTSINDSVLPFIKEQLVDIFVNVNSAFSLDMIQTKMESIENIYAEISYDVVSSGKKRKFFGAVLGGVLAMFAAPIAGPIGSALGTITQSSKSKKTIHTKIKLGNNKETVISNFLIDFESEIRSRFLNYSNSIFESTFMILIGRLNELHRELKSLYLKLNDLYIDE